MNRIITNKRQALHLCTGLGVGVLTQVESHHFGSGVCKPELPSCSAPHLTGLSKLAAEHHHQADRVSSIEADFQKQRVTSSGRTVQLT